MKQRKRNVIGRVVWSVLLAVGQIGAAALWNETTNGGADAGDLLANAQLTVGSGPLTEITGDAYLQGAFDADVYAIKIVDVANFSITSATPGFVLPLAVYLFDAAGKGVVGYIDSANIGIQLSNQFVASTGLFYLAIHNHGGFGVLPMDINGNGIWNSTPQNNEVAPNGLGLLNPMVSWPATAEPYLNPSPYAFDLTGVEFANIPEPMTLSLLALGSMAMMRYRKR